VYGILPYVKIIDPISLSIYYNPSDFEQNENLFLYHHVLNQFNPTFNFNKIDESYLNTDEHYISASLYYTGLYKIMYDENVIDTTSPPVDSTKSSNRFIIYQNRPNPFNNTTTITFDIPENGNIRVAIFNVLGKRIKHIKSGYQIAGKDYVIWDGRNDQQSKVTSGIYYCVFNYGNQTATMKMLFLK